ncbi:MAG: hypothetical protein H7329_16045 [Opitutaceae bacterium]|nr:hypothetical protein [Cytophagales bacterium]
MFLFTPLKKEIILSTCFFLLSFGIGMAQGPTNCGCDDQFDPETQSAELTLCLMNCDDADVPVNGNLWLLLLAGGGLLIYKRKTIFSIRTT